MLQPRDRTLLRWSTWRWVVALGVLALFVTMELLLMHALDVTPSAFFERLLPVAVSGSP